MSTTRSTSLFETNTNQNQTTQTELAKLNRKYANAGPAIQEEKRRLAATIAEMNAQYDEHRLALEGMRCVFGGCRGTCKALPRCCLRWPLP